jgi:hypothetical protein
MQWTLTVTTGSLLLSLFLAWPSLAQVAAPPGDKPVLASPPAPGADGPGRNSRPVSQVPAPGAGGGGPFLRSGLR